MPNSKQRCRRRKHFREKGRWYFVLQRKISKEDWGSWLDRNVPKVAVIRNELAGSREIYNKLPDADIPMICFWEVMYEYVNPETSLAYPQHVFPKDKVKGRTYYGTKAACQKMCNVINNLEVIVPFHHRKIVNFEL